MFQVEQIGQVIAARRRELNMTQEQLATLLHISPQAVSKWESGVGLPDLTLLPRISKALSLTPNELMGGERSTEGEKTRPIRRLRTRRSASDRPEGQQEDNTPADHYNGTFEGIHSFCITGELPCELELRRAKDGKTRIEATGEQRFLNALHIESDGSGTLRIDVPRTDGHSSFDHPNRITIFCGPSCGKELDLALPIITASIEPAFETVRYHSEEHSSATLRLSKVTNRLQVTGAGTLKLICTEVANPSVHRSNGLIEMTCEKVTGSMEFSSVGTSQVFLGGGTLDALQCSISGDLKVCANEVAVAGVADLQAEGNGTVTIGSVKKMFNAKFSPGTSLYILGYESA